MKAAIKFLEFDQILQVILLVSAGLSALNVGVDLVISLVFLGAWQIVSGIVCFYYLKGKPHAIYQVVFALFLITLGISVHLNFQIDFVHFFLIFPVIMPIYYYKLTTNTLKNIKELYLENYVQKEELLDDGLVWR